MPDKALADLKVLDLTHRQRPGPDADGPRHPSMAPHNCYRCKGEDRWVTICVSTEILGLNKESES